MPLAVNPRTAKESGEGPPHRSMLKPRQWHRDRPQRSVAAASAARPSEDSRGRGHAAARVVTDQAPPCGSSILRSRVRHTHIGGYAPRREQVPEAVRGIAYPRRRPHLNRSSREEGTARKVALRGRSQSVRIERQAPRAAPEGEAEKAGSGQDAAHEVDSGRGQSRPRPARSPPCRTSPGRRPATGTGAASR